MKRPRSGGRNTGHHASFRPTTTATTAAQPAALNKGHLRTTKLAMTSVAMWCAAASSSASAAAGGFRRGAYHTSVAFLHGFPLVTPGRIDRALQSGPAGRLRNAGSLLGVSRHQRAGEPMACCNRNAFIAGAAAATAEAGGARPPPPAWSMSLLSSPVGVVMSGVFSQNPGFRSSSALGRMSSGGRGGSRVFFGSGSSSRTAARKRRDRRQTTRAAKRVESSRLRSQREAAAAGRESGAGEAAAEAIEAREKEHGAIDRGQEAAMRGGQGEGDVGGGGEDAQEEQQQEGAPAGSLPYGTAYHIPVVCEEVLQWLVTNPEGVYVDCTLGGGGHSAALLSSLGPGARVVGLDRDPAALKEASTRLAAEAGAGRFQVVRSNFADVGKAVRDCELLLLPETEPNASSTSELSPVLVDGILVDLGVSSRQIDDGARGFSFSADGPLDMRMEGSGSGADAEGPQAGQMREEVEAPPEGAVGGAGGRESGGVDGGALSAFDVVNFADEMEIREMVWRYGDEKRSTKIAKAIVENRPIATTKLLAEVVGKCAPPKERVKTLARVFQALRIEVNGELDALEALLEQAKHLVRPGGRLLILSYHSLEDRRVKRVLASGNLKGKIEKDFYGNVLSPWKPLLRKPLMAGEAEVALNPRARSVRLRVAERTDLR